MGDILPGKIQEKDSVQSVIVGGGGVIETKSHKTETLVVGYYCLANRHSANGTFPLMPTPSLVPATTLKGKYHRTHLTRKKRDLERLSKSSKVIQLLNISALNPLP